MPSSHHLAWYTISQLFDTWPPDLGELASALRSFVVETIPQVSESSSGTSLSYFKDSQSKGPFGGNICLITSGGDCLHLAFNHGTSLPDPKGLLRGNENDRRYVEIRCPKDIRRSGLRKLLLAAEAHSPTTA
jgi:hypothetical protein